MRYKANYLIEYRFQGSAKRNIRSMIHHLKEKFHLPSSGKVVPHITLAGGFTTDNEKKLLKDFVSICSKSPLSKFTIDGFGYFANETGVIYINIKADENLKKFRWNLSQTICKYCKLKKFDFIKDFKFHATLVLSLGDREFSRIKKYIDEVREPQYRQVLIRATILRNGKIWYEYDFLQRRLLNRTEALSKRELTKTFHLLDEYLKGNYNPDAGLVSNQESWISKIPFIGKFLAR